MIVLPEDCKVALAEHFRVQATVACTDRTARYAYLMMRLMWHGGFTANLGRGLLSDLMDGATGDFEDADYATQMRFDRMGAAVAQEGDTVLLLPDYKLDELVLIITTLNYYRDCTTEALCRLGYLAIAEAVVKARLTQSSLSPDLRWATSIVAHGGA